MWHSAKFKLIGHLVGDAHPHETIVGCHYFPHGDFFVDSKHGRFRICLSGTECAVIEGDLTPELKDLTYKKMIDALAQKFTPWLIRNHLFTNSRVVAKNYTTKECFSYCAGIGI